MKLSLSFIGAGNLAEAIINAIAGNADTEISIFDVNLEQYKKYDGLDINRVYDLKDIVLCGDIIFLMVKPNDFPELLGGIKDLNLDLSKKIFVSTAAAVSTDFIQKETGQKIAVVRTMPNTPIFTGKGMTALCRSGNVTDAGFEKVCGIFKSRGETIILPEERMNDIIAVNGSSPAYVYLFAEAMLEGAARLGFDKRAIYPVVLQSLAGSLDMLIDSGKMPDELIKAVASPNGTTEKALESFYADDFAGIIERAMTACANRAEEMAREFN